MSDAKLEFLQAGTQTTGRYNLNSSLGHSYKYMALSLRKQIASALLLGMLFLCQDAAFAQEATLTNITVSNTRDDLLLYLNLEGAFTEKLKKATLTGVPATFSFLAKLNRVRNMWLNPVIADIKLFTPLNTTI